jgi:very-short-patch-repair endonuclease
MRENTPARHLTLARRLRRDMTDAERLLWSKVRGHRLAGLSFRRQVPMLGYIADFVCHEAMLVIELDGDHHGRDAGLRKDAARDAAFEAAGYRVMRFPNPELYEHLDDIVETIYRAAVDRMPVHPDHQFWQAVSVPDAAARE